MDGDDVLLSLRDALLEGKFEKAASQLFCLWRWWFNRNSENSGGRSQVVANVVLPAETLQEEWL